MARRLRATDPVADVEIATTPQGVPTVQYNGRWLASRHRPVDEAVRIADGIDFTEQATVIVAGFGLGYHVREIAQRMGRTGVVIVFEPDVPLLRTVMQIIDMSAWLDDANVIIVNDADDRGGLAQLLQSLETILLIGGAFIEPPAHRERLADSYPVFLRNYREHITSAETTLMTTLMRSYDTVRNLLLNIDAYAMGEGIEPLRDAAHGCPAVVVSAGPSLHHTIHALAEPGVRDRCVIIAVQTALRPLLDAGVRPHFITALDYHEISRRFYEELTPAEVDGITLIADPKVHPYVVRSWPGAIRCCASPFLDLVLGETSRTMGALKAGATVAHLALYVAEFIGCRRIALTGQDLGFPDGLYYAPGTAIHRVWSPELNSFNTIAMMEWERIARMRRHLHRATDVHGRTIYTDTQMLTYLRHFEADFARCRERGVEIHDATEGGVAKQHVTNTTLAGYLAEHATATLPAMPMPDTTKDRKRHRAVRTAITERRRAVHRIRQLAREARTHIDAMLANQGDQRFVDESIDRVHEIQRDVERNHVAFALVNHLNQLGSYRRIRADRRLQTRQDMTPFDRQRGELQRDHDNLKWIMDAAEHLDGLLQDGEAALRGAHVEPRASHQHDQLLQELKSSVTRRIVALVPVHPTENALGWSRDLTARLRDSSVLETTLRRLDTSRELDAIMLVAPHDCPAIDALDPASFRRPVIIERVDADIFDGAVRAIGHARRWSPTSWRSGLAGTSVYDEVLRPDVMAAAMARHGFDHGAVVGPEWIFVNVTGPGGLDAIIERERTTPGANPVTFTQAPPGFSGCLVHRDAMERFASRTRGATIGAALGYQPSAPAPDAIAYPVNVQVDADLRHAPIRATYDSRRTRVRIDRCLAAVPDLLRCDAATVARYLEHDMEHHPDAVPMVVQLELSTRNVGCGLVHRHPYGRIERAPMTPERAERLFSMMGAHDDICLTIDGVGDPLEHPDCAAIVAAARNAGIISVHLRTSLRAPLNVIDAVIRAGVHLLSIDLHATTSETYRVMMGTDSYDEVINAIDHIVTTSRSVTTLSGRAAMALPWLVPVLRRCEANYAELERFHDTSKNNLAASLIETPPLYDGLDRDVLRPAVTPNDVVWRQLMSRMTILSDGTIPVSELDHPGVTSIGTIDDLDLEAAWSRLVDARRQARDESGMTHPMLRLYRP